MEKNKRFKRSEAWIDEALYDFDTCRELHNLSRYNWVCTCSQQVGEKSIKSLFLVDSEYQDLRHCASELDPHYVETRYPDAIGGIQAPYKYYDKLRSEECLRNAGRILEWVKKQIQLSKK